MSFLESSTSAFIVLGMKIKELYTLKRCLIFVCCIGNTENPHTEYHGSQSFTSEVEHIKEQINCENISFVRFESTDLHGVSRSKTVPASLFHVNTYHTSSSYDS